MQAFLNCMQKCLEIVNRVHGEDKNILGNLDYQEYIMASKYDHWVLKNESHLGAFAKIKEIIFDSVSLNFAWTADINIRHNSLYIVCF